MMSYEMTYFLCNIFAAEKAPFIRNGTVWNATVLSILSQGDDDGIFAIDSLFAVQSHSHSIIKL